MQHLNQARQGDVWLEKVSTIPPDAKKMAIHGRLILAEGEVTGHAHAISVMPNNGVLVEAYEKDGTLFLHVEGDGCVLTHEEHGKISIPPGDYMSYIQGEYSPEELRNVAD